MRLYLANIERWGLPERGQRLIVRRGHQLAGNWLEPPFQQSLREFAPDLIVYAPHRQQQPLSWRDAAITLSVEILEEVPTILWALYPDYLTGWDLVRNEHADGFLEPVRQLLPHFRAALANSRFTRELLEARVPGFIFEVCYPGIDTKGIDAMRGQRRQGARARTVLWQHRWAIDKNLPGALEVVLELAPKHPEVTFYLGRKENWDEEFFSPPWLKELYATHAPGLESLANVRSGRAFSTQEEYWNFIGGVDIAFSCSYHETFGIGMLEQAYAGAACVVPCRVAYSEVHAGAMVVEPSRLGESISTLLQDPTLWTKVVASSRANAAKYDVEETVDTLLKAVEGAM